MNPSSGFPTSGTSAVASLAVRLIRHAARQVPYALAERLEEEWLAELAAQQPAPFARLRFALGCCWAACVIAHDLTAGSSTIGRSIALELQSLLPGRSGAFLVVVCAHLAALHLLGSLRFPPQTPGGPVVVSLQLSALNPELTSSQAPATPLEPPDSATPSGGRD